MLFPNYKLGKRYYLESTVKKWENSFIYRAYFRYVKFISFARNSEDGKPNQL